MLNVVDSKTQSFPYSDFARDLSVLFILDERLFYAEKKQKKKVLDGDLYTKGVAAYVQHRLTFLFFCFVFLIFVFVFFRFFFFG